MGFIADIFRPPKPKPVVIEAPPPPEEVVEEATDEAAGAAEAEAEQLRKRRTGQRGTILTSTRGLLEEPLTSNPRLKRTTGGA